MPVACRSAVRASLAAGVQRWREVYHADLIARGAVAADAAAITDRMGVRCVCCECERARIDAGITQPADVVARAGR